MTSQVPLFRFNSASDECLGVSFVRMLEQIKNIQRKTKGESWNIRIMVKKFWYAFVPPPPHPPTIA